MKIITIAHQKGGVGKSTIALNIATELSKQEKVKVIDLDYQKSLTIYNQTRKEQKLLALNIIHVANKKELMNAIDRSEESIIIDSGGFDSELNRVALMGSDLIITPVSNNMIEIYGLETFKNILEEIKDIKENLKAHVLLNNINPRATKAIDELKEYIKTNNNYFNLFETVIRRRADFASSFEKGKSVMEINPKSKAAHELKNLLLEINNA